MSRTRTIEVDECQECPYFEMAYTNEPFHYVCENPIIKRRKISDKLIHKIQKWCPLEYYPYHYGNDGMKDEYGDY